MLPFVPENDTIVREVLGAYDLPATVLGAVRYGQGHINDTFCVLCQPQEGDCIRFILQGLSSAAFPHPEELMENFIGITSYLRDKVIAAGGDPLRETLSLVKTRDGKDFYTDSNGKVWRLTPFIENTDCFQSPPLSCLKPLPVPSAASSTCSRATPPKPSTRPS